MELMMANLYLHFVPQPMSHASHILSGVDYFGPLNVRRERSVVKKWGAIFTGLNS